jgi:hypothetical protein
MKSELTDDFVKCFAKLPEIVKQTARKNYKLWKQNPTHPSWLSRHHGVKCSWVLQILKDGLRRGK